MASNMSVDDFLVNLKLSGLHPKFQNTKTRVKCALIFSMITFMLLSMVVTLDSSSSMDEFADAIESIGSLYQVCCKSITLMINHKDILVILQHIESLWPWNKYGKKLENELTKTHAFVRKLYRFFYIFATASVYGYLANRFFSGQDMALYRGSVCDMSLAWCTWCYRVLCVVGFHFMIIIIVGFDGFFFACVVYAYGEFKMVRHAFEHLDLTEDPEENCKIFAEIVEHHNKILRFLHVANKVMAFALVNQFAACVASICIELFAMNTYTSTDALGLINKGMIMFCYFYELGIYCLAGSFLYQESLAVADAAYNIRWWNEDKKKISRGIVSVIQRAQKPARFTIAGIAPLDLETLTQVIKFCMSVFTFLKTVFVPE